MAGTEEIHGRGCACREGEGWGSNRPAWEPVWVGEQDRCYEGTSMAREVKLFAFSIRLDLHHPFGIPQALGSLLANISDFEI